MNRFESASTIVRGAFYNGDNNVHWVKLYRRADLAILTSGLDVSRFVWYGRSQHGLNYAIGDLGKLDPALLIDIEDVDLKGGPSAILIGAPLKFRLAEPSSVVPLHEAPSDTCLNMLKSLMDYAFERMPPSAGQAAELSMQHATSFLAVAFLSQILETAQEEYEIALLSGTRSLHLRRILAEIRSNYRNNNLTPATIAHRSNVSTRYLHSILKETGSTFSERVLHLRLMDAYTQIVSRPDDVVSIGQLSFDVGFNDFSYFTKCFREYFGVTPSALREKHHPNSGTPAPASGDRTRGLSGPVRELT